ncbi:hypothetical protein DFH11DRAFT_1651633 [Phellopilus nigrolimitatus]|nr:hypothetical protein DFH11DRAFT_1651633 [Phellopilus nigrolimitatus]
MELSSHTHFEYCCGTLIVKTHSCIFASEIQLFQSWNPKYYFKLPGFLSPQKSLYSVNDGHVDYFPMECSAPKLMLLRGAPALFCPRTSSRARSWTLRSIILFDGNLAVFASYPPMPSKSAAPPSPASCPRPFLRALRFTQAPALVSSAHAVSAAAERLRPHPARGRMHSRPPRRRCPFPTPCAAHRWQHPHATRARHQRSLSDLLIDSTSPLSRSSSPSQQLLTTSSSSSAPSCCWVAYSLSTMSMATFSPHGS